MIVHQHKTPAKISCGGCGQHLQRNEDAVWVEPDPSRIRVYHPKCFPAQVGDAVVEVLGDTVSASPGVTVRVVVQETGPKPRTGRLLGRDFEDVLVDIRNHISEHQENFDDSSHLEAALELISDALNETNK